MAAPSILPFPSPPELAREPAPVRVAFIVPAFNEASTIRTVLDRIEALGLDQQVIVVDDGSTDATPVILEAWQMTRPWATVIRQPNRGKGAAIRAGLDHVDREIVVIQDADLEYDPADVVFGSSLRGGRPQRAHMFWHLVGNRCLSLLTNVLYNTTLSDMETGYKAFRTEVLRSLELHRNSFAVEPEITAKVCKRKLRIYELPISYYGRSYAEGKKITWRDGFGAVSVLVSERFRS